ncbi:hypothetical protein MDAP_002359 [Mitosporidium daphniae]|uniref:Uncharacterized protein n=1 Tax=Mitosporidium daphniae TaxID=1485682 RepID=A0A098VMQ8_9MICR|nr:uncharacterized protein DI09_77p130 [Mitosporidium daphniae]KGG50323.1 hypothetical protein DI09_77p130 [Mitosporidium daphniae]|eukprot:XP_013236750.1 uncharacterized protein DI09_77p130 [Mitosporidium daphniae]
MFPSASATVSVRLKYPIERLQSIYQSIALKACEIFDEDPSILWRKNPLKNINLNKRDATRDGIKYLSGKTYALDYLSYFPLNQNELLYPLRTKYASIVPIKHAQNPNSPSSKLKDLLPSTAKTSFTDIDRSKNYPVSNEEQACLSTLESSLEPDGHLFHISRELGAAFNFIPPELNSVYKANVRERKKIHNKLPPARSVVKRAKKTKK